MNILNKSLHPVIVVFVHPSDLSLSLKATYTSRYSRRTLILVDARM